MPQLLDMTAAQLADAGTQQRRQQQLSELMSDKVRFSSVEEVAKLREDEARQGLEAVMDVGMAGVGAGASAPTSPKDGGAMDVEVSGSAETKRRLEAPSDQLAKQARTTSGPSLRIDPATSASGSAVPSPRAPSLLNSILANKVATTAAKSSAGPVHYEELSSAAKPQLLTFLSSAAQLITSSGGSAVTITRPGTGAKRAVTMAGEAWVLDRQLQGIAKPLMNIDGRVKLEEFVRIINKLQAMLNDARALSSPYRKLFSVFRMAVKGAGVEGSEAAASYKSFCTEFATENRVGLSNIGPKDSAGGAQMYVLPPALRHCLPIFGSFDELQEGMEGVGRGDELLYGVITNKDKGPEAYVSGEFFVSGERRE
ncbi:hypothetical protein B484DRAFT_2054 [Ochromonadaceae sp. CCMP2298]|nr:hypothetical protein B484DRAFT_2054 [Ochromonadaceae sp. CCMP2298]